MRIRRILLIALVFVVSYQVAGFEEAFCDDPGFELSCQDCLSCSGHSFISADASVALPAISFAGFRFVEIPSFKVEEPSLGFLRPPISR